MVSGEGGEELPEGSEKLEGDEDSGSMTPTSAASPAPGDEDINSPPAGDLPSSPRSSVHEDATLLQNHITEKYVLILFLIIYLLLLSSFNIIIVCFTELFVLFLLLLIFLLLYSRSLPFCVGSPPAVDDENKRRYLVLSDGRLLS